MGGGSGGGYSTAPSDLASNIKNLSSKFKLNGAGKFGKRRRGAVQILESKDPLGTGKQFFEKLGYGGKVSDLANGKGKISVFKDKSTVVFRPVSSSDGSPVISILLKGPSGLDYKIHFVQEKGVK
jgi:hypothetical protein